MTRTRIFVSHASQDQVDTKTICDLLDDEDGFDVLVDFERLKSGYSWDVQLHEWMGRCDAAFILFTPHAAASAWVLKEATILSQRAALEDFPIYMAKPADIDEKILRENKWNPLDIDRIQLLEATTPAGIAAELREEIGPPQATSPFDAMVSTLANLLKNVDEGRLERVAARLNKRSGPDDQQPPLKEFPWSSAITPRERYLEAIARHLICGRIGEYNRLGLEGLIGDIGWTPSSDIDLRKILMATGPHWVDPEAAALVAVLPELPADERHAVAMNGRYVTRELYTATQHVRRAHLDDSMGYRLWPIPNANDGRLLDHFSDEICKRAMKEFSIDMAETPADGSARDYTPAIKRLARSKRATVYVVLPAVLPPDDLRVLLQRFPKLNFIMATGDTLDVVEDDVVDVPRRPVDLDIEQEWFDDWEAALLTIENTET